MDIFLVHGPETPDPTQLELFDMGVKNAETVQNSTDSAQLSLSSETMIRSPTVTDGIQQGNGKKFELNLNQERFASSLQFKSRELVRKSKEKHIELLKSEPEEENDLAR